MILIRSIQDSTADAVRAMDEGTQRIATTNQLAAEAGKALDELRPVAQQIVSDMESVARSARRGKYGSSRADGGRGCRGHAGD